MLDMSWSEVMLIGGVALIVIGPKDLPKALRTVGQITRKMRRMAGEFQSQFNEAIREAEFDEIRREVDGVKRSTRTMGSTFNPVQIIRDDLKGAVDGRVVTRTTPSPTQGLANVADQLAERETTIPAPPQPAPIGSPPASPSDPASDLSQTDTSSIDPLAVPVSVERPHTEMSAKPELQSGR